MTTSFASPASASSSPRPALSHRAGARSSWRVDRLALFGAAAVLAAAFGGCGEGDDPAAPPGPDGCMGAGPLLAPSMPDTLQPPAGQQLFLRLRAEGTQIYTCQASSSGGYGYVLKAPDARLIDDACAEVGSHGAGPHWALRTDGSAVMGKKMAEAPASLPGAVPWLLLSASSSGGPGLLAQATFIQRVETVGGVAPTEGCDAVRVGQELAIPYTATYLYYRPGTGGTPASPARGY